MPPPSYPVILRAAGPRNKLRSVAATALLGGVLLGAAPVVAQGAGQEPGAMAGKRPYAGPQYSGKPPMLDAGSSIPDPFPSTPRVTAPGGAGLPPAGARPASSGTGFVVADGRVLTNNHVVAECSGMVARNADGTRAAARVLSVDRVRDLALLAVPDGFGPALTFRDAPAVKRGETVVTYGFPLSGLLSSGPTLTTGDISALSGLRDSPLNFQISAPVQPGNSGGPLLDAQGNVIGVVVSKLNAARIAEMTGGDIPQNVNFAVKGSEALAFLRQAGVRPRAMSSVAPDKRPSDIGDIANPSTVYLQCFR